MTDRTTIECDPGLARPTAPLDEVSPKLAVEHLLRGQVEACSEYGGSVIASDYHAFIAALHRAFVDHRPFVLSPDMLWLLIAQGFANHVNKNAEEMRAYFVKHEEKKLLEVIRNDFYKGSPENPWDEVFGAFSAHIKREIGDANHSNIVATFSTTGPIEKAACEVVLMDSMKSYFDYLVTTRCGIPEVQLEGKSEDWIQLTNKAHVLGSTYKLTWWTDRILPWLEKIAEQSQGRGDPTFWRDIYKWNGGSGGPYFNGWIVDFIPYVTVDDSMMRNWLFQGSNDFEYHGMRNTDLPSSLSMVPFIWDYCGTQFQYQFVAGFTSFTQDHESLAIRPKIGWAVRELVDTESRHNE